MKRIVFLDMDGVLADFDGALPPDERRPDGSSQWDPPSMFQPGFYRNLPVMEGAKNAIDVLMKEPDLDIYVGSKPTTKNLWCATEKYQWIAEHFPALLKKMVLVCDKSLLRGDYLVDDDADRWANVFKGQFIHFDRTQPEVSWSKVIVKLIAGV